MSEIYLSEAHSDEYDEYYKIRCSPLDVYWNGHLHAPNYESLKAVYEARIGDRALEEQGEHKIYFIRLGVGSSDDPYVGFFQLTRYGEEIELGYAVLEEYGGRGYATEALASGVRIARHCGRRLVLRIRDDNLASQRVAAKNGFMPTERYDIEQFANCGETILRVYEES